VGCQGCAVPQILKKAQTSNKPYVLTESRNNKFGMNAQWWTEALYPGIKNSGIAWVLMWRKDGPDHYFASYKGDVAEEDFKTFEDLKEILFLKEISKINY
jgi:mannan endo-1,4-beta-mannosidase|tara:strand:- start:57 stop:356 length:300 start_codon:yes stop_codon:yes gene_type:complete